MNVNLILEEGMRVRGTNARGMTTLFDTNGDAHIATSASPMEIMLESLGGCSTMDVISILRKQRRTITDFRVDIEAERAEEHPKVFISAHLKYTLTSPDATLNELTRAVELSQEKYCSASAMFIRSGCEITYEAVINLPQ
ncbi:MAG: OsmC family protein [Bacteroidetes bacterium]|nr:OsmC family protein [Bacteroidota bacterium]